MLLSDSHRSSSVSCHLLYAGAEVRVSKRVPRSRKVAAQQTASGEGTTQKKKMNLPALVNQLLARATLTTRANWMRAWAILIVSRVDGFLGVSQIDQRGSQKRR